MLCPVDMEVTQSSDTTNCVTSFQIYVARHTCLSAWKRVMVCVVTSITPVQLMSLWRVGRGQPAALDITVTSSLTPVSLKDSSRIAGVAALSAETRKHVANDPKCRELGWMCIPMAVETYGNWGKEAQHLFSRLATYLAISIFPAPSPDIYGRLNICLVRAAARAILARGLSPVHL